MADSVALLRAQFPSLDQGLCFLDWGSTGLVPRATRDAILEFTDRVAACESRSSTWFHGEHAAMRNRVRKIIADELGSPAGSGDIALLESTTHGLNTAVSAIRMKPGENVVLAGADYLAVSTPFKHRARRDEIEVRYVDPQDGRMLIDDILMSIDERTRVVAMSTVGWTTGALLDVESVAGECRSRGILLVLDAVQTFGVVPLDLERSPAAFVSVGGHKWLCSPLGTGFLYVHKLVAARHQPPYVGFLSGCPKSGSWPEFFEDPNAGPDAPVMFPATGRTYEVGGTAGYPGTIGLLSMLELLTRVGVEKIYEHVLALGDQLIDGLRSKGLILVTPEARFERGGLIVFQTGEGLASEKALVERLRDQGIVVSVRYSKGQGGVRASLHGMNSTDDVERVLAAL